MNVFEENKHLRGLLRELISDLPSKRDWLDPVLEARMKDAALAEAVISDNVPQDEQEAFEAHLVANHGYLPYRLRSQRLGDSYQGIALPLAYSAWQARPVQTEQSELIAEMQYIIFQIYNGLPGNRDWLDPTLEARMKELRNKRQK